jgi:hypothetical protein
MSIFAWKLHQPIYLLTRQATLQEPTLKAYKKAAHPSIQDTPSLERRRVLVLLLYLSVELGECEVRAWVGAKLGEEPYSLNPTPTL